MSGIRRLDLKFSLEQTVLHELAKFCWGKFILREDVNGSDRCSCHGISTCDEIKLILYRDNVVKHVPRILNGFPKASSSRLPKNITDKVINAVFNLFEGYLEALRWERHYNSSLPFSVLNPFTSGNYEAGNYIDAERYFNDFVWAKRFVADEEQFIENRFKFACLYCFEEDIRTLWNTMKSKGELLCEGYLKSIRRSCGPLILLWVHHHEKVSIIFAGDRYHYGFYNNSLFLAALGEAFNFNYEYAAHYFWNRCSGSHKATFLDINVDSYMYAKNCIPYRMSNFIYLNLSQEQKNNFIWTSVQMYGKPFMIWSYLLHSPFYESVLEDIFDFSFSVPIEAYGGLLDLLSRQIRVKEIPIHKKIFKQIWNHLSNEQQKEVLKMELQIISNLIKIGCIDLLKIIIQPLSNADKEILFLDNQREAGISAIDKLLNLQDYDDILRYIMLFLIEGDFKHKKLRVSINAYELLDRFIKSKAFIDCIKTKHSASVKETNTFMECIQGSLSTIFYILNKVTENTYASRMTENSDCLSFTHSV